MKTEDRNAAYALLADGTLVDFDVIDSKITATPDKTNVSVTIELVFKADEESEPEEVVEWGSFGFIFALAVLSFADARPRGFSDQEYNEHDEFNIADFHQCLTFNKTGLHFSADYIRGRCLKTDITVRPNGTVQISTRNRGRISLRWLDRLKGKKLMQLL